MESVTHQKNSSLFQSTLITIYFVALSLWWLSINSRGLVDTTENYYYGLVYGLLPFFGGIIGIYNSKKWGFFSSYLGKSLLFLSFGLMTWSLGNVIYAYYNFFQSIEVPYPSVADFIYILSWPLWSLGLINLLRTTGVKFRLKVMKGKIMLFIIPIAVFIASYYLLFIVARQGSIVMSDNILKLVFDIGYPAGDIVVLTITLLIYSFSVSYLGGFFKKAIWFILVGFVINYFADFSYAYLTNLGEFYVGGWVDYVYTIVMFLLCIGISQLNPKRIE